MTAITSRTRHTLTNGISFELLAHDGLFLGIGQIQAHDVPLRSGERPMFVEIRNPGGLMFCHYRLTEMQATPDGLALSFAMDVREGGPMEWMVHATRQRYNTADWSAAPRPAAGTTLRMTITPVSRLLGERTYQGFTYQYHFQSDDIPIYKILDRATWEPGCAASGNEFWQRSCFVPSITEFTDSGQFYSSEWYLPSAHNPNIFQFLPWQTELQGFTFTASAKGMLVTWATRAAHLRSLFEKPRGNEVIVHLHEHCADLAHTFTSAPVEVLWTPGATDRVERANAYEAVRNLVADTLHAEIGMRRERVTTYGQIEEWEAADISRYTALGLPKLLDAGAKTVYLTSLFRNMMNTWGLSCMCGVIDYQFPEEHVEPLRDFCRQAHAAGARVQLWGNPILSALVPLFAKRHGSADRIRFLPREGSVMEAFERAEQPWLRTPSGAIDADHYAPELVIPNLRDPVVMEYWLSAWEMAHEVGIDSVFNDSAFNVASDHFHYTQNATLGQRHGATADQTALLGYFRPAEEPPQSILSEYPAYLRMLVDWQRLGYTYAGESLGVFGVCKHGPEIDQRLNSLPIWVECLANFDIPLIRQAGGDPDAVFFKGLAYRMMWILNWDIQQDALSFRYGSIRGDDDRPTHWHLALLRVFNAVTDLMLHRVILPDEAGVVYHHDDRQVLWAFSDLEYPLPAAICVRDVLTGEAHNTDRVRASQYHVYVIG